MKCYACHLSCLMTKPTKWLCAKRRLRSAWASAQSDQFSLSEWRKRGSLATYWVYSEDSDQTRRMPRLIWVFAGRTTALLALSWGGSFVLIIFLPSNASVTWTPDNILSFRIHVCSSEHSDLLFVYRFMSLIYGLNTFTTDFFYDSENFFPALITIISVSCWHILFPLFPLFCIKEKLWLIGYDFSSSFFIIRFLRVKTWLSRQFVLF